MTQGKDNLNAILGAKINFNKEGLGFVPKIKKKYDVQYVTFISEKNILKKNPLIKLNSSLQNLSHIASLKHKGEEIVGKLKPGQINPNKSQKTIMLGLNPS